MTKNRNNQDDSTPTIDILPLLATSTAVSVDVLKTPGVQISRPRKTIYRRTTKRVSTLSSDLTSKLGGDLLVAASVTLGVAPFLTVIDKAVVQRAAGTHSVFQSVFESTSQMFRNPVTYFRSPMFLMMWGVYCSTYATANCLKTITEHNEHFRNTNKTNVHTTESSSLASTNAAAKVGVFAVTTVVNSTTSLLKDRYYATHFGSSGVPKIPMITYGLWGLRDCMVIGSSFILPDTVSGILQEHTEMDKETALRVSQFACPIAAQFFAAPVQLLGLDIYNRPLEKLTFGETVAERISFQYKNLASIVGTRICRIAPAYGIGGIGNTFLRDKWRNHLLQKEL